MRICWLYIIICRSVFLTVTTMTIWDVHVKTLKILVKDAWILNRSQCTWHQVCVRLVLISFIPSSLFTFFLFFSFGFFFFFLANCTQKIFLFLLLFFHNHFFFLFPYFVFSCVFSFLGGWGVFFFYVFLFFSGLVFCLLGSFLAFFLLNAFFRGAGMLSLF